MQVKIRDVTMETTKFTKITAEVSGREKIIIEFPTDDITVSDICQAFRTIMIGMTFSDKGARERLASYLKEYYGEKYDVVSIDG